MPFVYGSEFRVWSLFLHIEIIHYSEVSLSNEFYKAAVTKYNYKCKTCCLVTFWHRTTRLPLI